MTIIKAGVVSEKCAIAMVGRVQPDGHSAGIGVTIIKAGVVSEKVSDGGLAYAPRKRGEFTQTGFPARGR